MAVEICSRRREATRARRDSEERCCWLSCVLVYACETVVTAADDDTGDDDTDDNDDVLGLNGMRNEMMSK